MKKSEMLTAIVKVITTHKDAEVNEIAKAVLEEILQKGMLPPETEIPFMRQFGPNLDVTHIIKDRRWNEE